MFKFKHKTKAPAFSLIEMTVSISIIALISAIFVANYRTGNQRTDLSMASQSLVSDLHLAQNNSLGLIKYGDDLPMGGWGIHLERASSSYLLFADQPDSEAGGTAMTYDFGEGDINLGARITNFSPSIYIDKLQLSNGSEINVADITFLPPDPITNIKGQGVATSTAIDITLKETQSDTTKTVRVNILGLAEVID